MKGQDKAPQGKQTAASVRRERVLRICCISLRILLILSTVLCVWITDIGCAWGWIKNARAGENWPMDFVAYGQTMIAAAALLTAGAAAPQPDGADSGDCGHHAVYGGAVSGDLLCGGERVLQQDHGDAGGCALPHGDPAHVGRLRQSCGARRAPARFSGGYAEASCQKKGRKSTGTADYLRHDIIST